MIEMIRKDFEQIGLPWPEPGDADPIMLVMPRLRFSRCVWLERRSGIEVVHYIPRTPTPPEREVPARTETFVDDDGYEEEMVTEWRTLSDAEYADAVKKYEKANETHRADPGIGFVQGAVPPPRATFVMEDGSFTEALLDLGRRKWIVTEWRSAS